MTFTQRGGNLPADEYSRAMRGSLIFFDRIAEHLGETLKARHDTADDVRPTAAQPEYPLRR